MTGRRARQRAALLGTAMSVAVFLLTLIVLLYLAEAAGI